MTGRASVDKILEKAKITLDNEDNEALNAAINNYVDFLDTTLDASDLAAHLINSTISRISEKHNGSDTLKLELRKAFLSMAKTNEAKAILEKKFALDGIVKGFKLMVEHVDKIPSMGDTYDKEFFKKAKHLVESYHKASPVEKGKTLLTNLESLGKWSAEQEQISKGSIFSKIGTIISFYTKAAKAYLSGDKEAYTKNMYNASITITILKENPKQLSNTLEIITAHTTKAVKRAKSHVERSESQSSNVVSR